MTNPCGRIAPSYNDAITAALDRIADSSNGGGSTTIDLTSTDALLTTISGQLTAIQNQNDPQIEATVVIGQGVDSPENRFLVRAVYDEVAATWTYTLSDGTVVQEGVDFEATERFDGINYQLFRSENTATGQIPNSMAAHGYVITNNTGANLSVWLADQPLTAGDLAATVARVTPVEVMDGGFLGLDEVFPEPTGAVFGSGIFWGISSDSGAFAPVASGDYSLTISYS